MSLLDRCIQEFDQMLRTLHAVTPAGNREVPAAAEKKQSALNAEQKTHSAGLMRVNQSGEVMAQALYQAQALTAKTQPIRQMMLHAAEEEQEHLHWCQTRLKQLDSQPSLLNPFWYGASFVMGAGVGLLGDKISLGFGAAVEDQVSEHLQSHLQSLAAEDAQSRAIVQQMLEDEQAHAQQARQAGGAEFPLWVKKTMTANSKVMTALSYKI